MAQETKQFLSWVLGWLASLALWVCASRAGWAAWIQFAAEVLVVVIGVDIAQTIATWIKMKQAGRVTWLNPQGKPRL